MAVNLVLVVIITLACAVASWHLVEKPSMKLKDWLTGKLKLPAAGARHSSKPTAESPAPPESEPVAAEQTEGSSERRRTP